MPKPGRDQNRGGNVAVRVMVVDDTDHVREMLAQMLELSGFEIVAQASNGPAAIELAQRARPDIVVMDYKMPGMDGITATRALLEKIPKLPVILYTAYLEEDLEKQARDAGVSACIEKIEGLHTLEREISALCLELVDR